MKMKLKTMISIIGIVVMTASYLLFSHLFITAYVNPNDEVTVSINDFKEADLELILLITTFPMVMFSFFNYLNLIKNYENLKN